MGNCIRGGRFRWPNGRVPYVIGDDLSAGERALVEAAVTTWNTSGTGVSFEPYTGPPPPFATEAYALFVRGTEDTSCRTKAGRRAPAQKIYCHLGVSTLVHEMGHTLGLKHEHQRFDRALHVAVLTDNAIAHKRGNFARLSIDAAIPVGVYDFDSTMHYGQESFAVDFEVNAEIPGAASRVGPAVAFDDRRLHVVYTNNDKELFHRSTGDMLDWSAPRRIEDQTTQAPSSLAKFDDDLVLVHIGESSSQIWISRSDDRARFSANQALAGFASRDVPALAVHGSELHMAFIGASDNEIRHSRSATGRPDDWTEPELIGQTSRAAPALVSDGSELHLVHVGNASSELWHSTSANGRDWTPDVKIGQQSKDTPALARSGGVVHLAHLGESSNQVWHATYNGAAGKFRSNHQTNQLSRQQPALAAGALGADPALILAHIGDESSRLYASRYNPSLRTLLAVDPDHKGDFGDSNLSAGDLDAVRFMYG